MLRPRCPCNAGGLNSAKILSHSSISTAPKNAFGRPYAHAIERWSMYRHILIPTDGSELSEHGVTNGLSLAKSVAAKVTAIIVEEPFNWHAAEYAGIGEIARHSEQMKKHFASVLNRVSNAAQEAGVSCDTIQVEHTQPY